MPQFPLCSEFIPLLDSVKNQLAELRSLSQEFLSSGDDEIKQKALLKSQQLKEAEQQLIDLKEQPTEFEGNQIPRIEQELLIFFKNRLGEDLKYKINNNRVQMIDVTKFVKSTGALESALKFVRLFSQLQWFYCYDIQIISPPELPRGLWGFWCHHTQITTLPKLPQGLQELYCGNTPITALPKELPRGLQMLYCDDTQITTLPELPQGLRVLVCYDTLITVLPELPDGLIELDCRNTPAAKNPETIK